MLKIQKNQKAWYLILNIIGISKEARIFLAHDTILEIQVQRKETRCSVIKSDCHFKNDLSF